MSALGALRRQVLPLLALGVGVLVWQFAGTQNPVLFATPGASIAALAEMGVGGSLETALWESAQVYFLGLAAAIFVGVFYGFLLSRIRWLREGTEWLVYVFQAIPVVALTPFILSGLGFGLPAKVLVVFIVTVFPILINTSEGARHVPAVLTEVATVYRSNEKRYWLDVLIPHSMPFVMTGVRQGIAVAFVGTVAAEFFLNPTGLGGLLLLAGSRFDSASALGLTLLIALIATLFVWIGKIAERRFSPWREEVRA
jgi:ABC-type nitrate/sulfonate/bicarbonate transport system permease component